MTDLTPRQAAALTDIDHAEVTVHHTGNPRYTSERRERVSWNTHDVTTLIGDGYAREGRDHVYLTQAGQRQVAGR